MLESANWIVGGQAEGNTDGYDKKKKILLNA